MVPLSHLLSGFLVGRFIRARHPRKQQNLHAWKDPIILVALAGSVVPDLDVIPGLLGVWPGSAFHRTATHSLLGSFILAGCLGGLAYAVFRRMESFKWLYLAALFGVWTHIGWDVLNTWGVSLFWPASIPTEGNLVHEGDFFVLASLVVCVVCSLTLRNRTALIVTLTVFPLYLLLSLAWQQQIARGIETRAGSDTSVFATRIPWCRWLVLSKGEEVLHADCVQVPLTTRMKRIKSVQVNDEPFVQASLGGDMVNEFRESVWYPFADVRPLDNGEVLVVWRDLRETFMDDDVDAGPGIHVRLNADGEILEEVHKWRLPFW